MDVPSPVSVDNPWPQVPVFNIRCTWIQSWFVEKIQVDNEASVGLLSPQVVQVRGAHQRLPRRQRVQQWSIALHCATFTLQCTILWREWPPAAFLQYKALHIILRLYLQHSASAHSLLVCPLVSALALFHKQRLHKGVSYFGYLTKNKYTLRQNSTTRIYCNSV